MLETKHFKIRTKLRIISLIALLSIACLGLVSNYFFQTSKVLGMMINAERIHNGRFQHGVEDFYKFRLTGDRTLLDSSIVTMNEANQMVYQFAIIDQLSKLPQEQLVDTLYKTYKEALSYDRENARLMASRLKWLLILRKDKIAEAQKITMSGYLIGSEVKKAILKQRSADSTSMNTTNIDRNLQDVRTFYDRFDSIISSLNDYANRMFYLGMMLIVIILISLLWITGNLIARSIVEPINTLVDNFHIIARGNLKTDIPIFTNNEIGHLASSFREIQSGLHKVIEYTKHVADGDYSQPITPRSDEDELSIALNKMVDKLKDSHEFNKNESWFKSGINQINEKLGGVHRVEDLSDIALRFMMNFLHSQLGSIHLFEKEKQSLALISHSGFDPKKLKHRILLDEGIIGQVALSKSLIVLNELPNDSYVTFSSSGNYFPKQIVVVPLMFNEILVGVLELSSVVAYSELELKFIKAATEILAINLSSAINILKTNDLLLKTQEQASELQVQQEELRVANEELTEHTKVLTESEKRLQVQQEELRVANEELEERTRQLEMQKDEIGIKNSELVHAKDELELRARALQQSSQYKSEFLANMSHELRTPLNSLLILSQLLAKNKKGNLTADQVQSASIIHKSGTDLLYLINDVLDLSKIEAGKMTFEFEMVSALEIKEEILSGFNAVAKEKNLSFEVAIHEGFPMQVETDRYRLMQIVKNLLSNAFKFTSKGYISVEFVLPNEWVKFGCELLNRENSFCIKVADSGVGIPTDKIEAIFEAFRQADGSISRKFGGTGLGLSISRELIKSLGGEIQLESEVNKGSVFYIYLPIKQSIETVTTAVTPSDRDVPQNPEKLPDSAPVIENHELPKFIEDDRSENINGRAVLIIHSSSVKAEKFMRQGRTKNFKVIVASSIADGIVLAEKFHPEAIMLEDELSHDEKDYDLLRSHSSTKKLPIHLISPLEFIGSTEEEGLKTAENADFVNALNALNKNIINQANRVLIIEDDPGTRVIVKELLADLDLNIKEASCADEGFQILSENSFDCVILDLGLPDYSGTDLLKKLRVNQIEIPRVIIYTGKEISKEEHKILSSYTNAIIIKGLKSDERLMDEITLFLHQVSRSIPDSQPKVPLPDKDFLFKGKKILVVDDEIRNVFALGKILEEHDIDVFEAENGAVAIDILKENKEIDLVLMDVMMPVLDGYEAISIIRKTPGIRDIPIICLTAKAMKEDHENALRNGANDYLSKPLNEEKLVAMLKIWLYKKQII